MEFTPSTPAHFSLVFFPETNATKLKIPAHVSIALEEYVTLRDMYKNIWQVKTRKNDGHWYLLDGWAKFVADQSLTSMDLLSFSHSGPNLLDVDILGTNGDIKEGVGYRNIVSPKKHLNMESDEFEGVGTFARISTGKNKRLVNYNCIKAKGNNENGSRKPQQEKRTVDFPCTGILKSVLGSKPKRSYSMIRIKPSYGNGSNKGKGVWKKVSEDEEDDDSEQECTELTPRNDHKGKRRMKKVVREDWRTFGSKNPYQKKEKIDDWHGNKVITSRSGPWPKIHSSAAKLSPQRMNTKDNIGKEILRETSDKDSDSDYWTYDSCDEMSEENFRSGINDLENAKKFKSKAKNAGNKRRNNDNPSNNKVITPSSTPKRKIPSSLAKRPPPRINVMDYRGKEILDESSDKDSDFRYWAYDASEDTSEEEFGSGTKCLENKRSLKSKAGDVKGHTSIRPRKRVRVDYLGKELFKSYNIPRPKGKYFVTTQKPRRMNELYIPKDILMDQTFWLPKKIKLVDPNENTYTSWLVSWTDGRAFYKGGWNRLGRRNRLTQNDYCICEFGEGDQYGQLLVTFVRELDE